jgi:hypothetical protein
MKRLVAFNQGQGTILVEVDGDTPAGDRLSARASDAVDTAKKSFEQAVAGIGPIADTILRQITSLGPENVDIEFGIKFNAEAGVILASSAIEANCKVTIGWKPKAASG